MIVWRIRCLELARQVNRHEKTRLIADKQKAWEMAREILAAEKFDDKVWAKYMEWWKCPDKEQAMDLFDEYLDMVRQQNEQEVIQ